MKNSRLLLGITSLVVLILNAGIAEAGTAGYVQFVNGQASLTTAGRITGPLQKGQAINEGDTIVTSSRTYVQVKMRDGGFISVRPATQLKFDSFVFTGKPGAPERSYFSLLKGGFRAVTGLIGAVRKNDYRITTPTATIGVRGTDHEALYLPVALPGALAGAYSKVNVGVTSLTTNKGTINVMPNQMGFAGGINQIPQLKPVNTILFTVAAAPTKTIRESREEKEKEKQQEQQLAQQEGGEQAKGDVQKSDGMGDEPVRAIAVVDEQAPAAGVSVAGTAAPAAPASETETSDIKAAETETVLPVKASTGGLKLDATAQTVTAGGTTVSVQDGIYSVQAKTAADAATAAASAASTALSTASGNDTTLLAIATTSTAPATTAIGSANIAVSSASPLVSSALALTPANAGTAASDALASAGSADTQAAAADAALTANGAFADLTAAPANLATQAANSALQSANGTLQSAAGTMATQNTTLSNAQNAASTALTSANTNLATANTALATAGTQNTAITSAQAAAATSLSAAQAAATDAQAAANTAQAAATQAATSQAAGDLTGAAAQLLIAQQQLAIAQAKQAIVQAAQVAIATQLANAQAAKTSANNAVTSATNAANTAATFAATSQTQAGLAGSASTAADNALATITAQSGTITSNAAIVNTNAPIAAHNNPVVVTPDRFVGVLSTVVAPAAGQYIEGYGPGTGFTGTGTANTSFVLDGAGNLVESRHTWYEQTPASTATPQVVVPDANVKRTGGTAAETFKLPDDSIYAGRWVGGSITVTDNAGVVSPITQNFGATSEHWAIMLAPATSFYVQALTGTTAYTNVAATSPTDALGNAGVLNTATLSADFTSQLVSAALNLSINSKTLDVQALNMAINGFGFSSAGAINPTCTGCATTYYANVGGMFAGDAAASVGVSYTLWSGATPGATTPATDLIQGLVAFNTATPPTVSTFDVAAQAAADATAAAATAAQTAATAVGTVNTTLTGIAQVSTTPADTAIGTATTDIGSATTAVGVATGLTAADATAAADNASAAVTAEADAAALAAAAQTALTANGAFADSTASPANDNVQSALTAAQTAKSAVQTNATTVVTQNTALGTAQTAASTALTDANTGLSTANSTVGTVAGFNSTIATEQAAAVTPLSAAQAAAVAANTAAIAAQAAATQAATLQGLGDLAGAQAQMVIAQNQLVIAQAELTNAQNAQAAVNAALTNAQAAQTAANTAVTDATTLAGTAVTDAASAQAQATAASAAATAASTALSTTVTQLALVNTNAATVAANAPIAAYNNPAVFSSNFMGHLSMPAPGTGGYDMAKTNNVQQANTQFVLNGSGNLVEVHSATFQIQPVESLPITNIANADIKYSGGSAADIFKLADNSLYMGRWSGATVTVTDLATVAPLAPFTLTPANSLWAVVLPPNLGYVQNLIGTFNYTKVANTTPTDYLGILGTYNSATLSADFTNQLVNAVLSVTMPATSSMEGTYAVTANNQVINSNGSIGGAPLALVNCTGTCAAGTTGYSAHYGGSFVGTSAASAILGYDIWPTVAANQSVTNMVNGLVAFSTGTAPSGPTFPAAGSYYSDFIVPMLTAGGYVMGAQTQSPPTSHTNFLLDGTGNLVKSLNAPFSGDVYSIANANITWSGGTVGDYYQSVNGNITFGRWQGGSMNVTDLSLAVAPFSISLAQTGGMVGPTSSLWEYVVAPPSGYIQTLVGTSSYTKTGNTTPFDSQGGSGVLNSASLTADFTNQMVSATLNLTMNTGPFASDEFDVSASMIPINPSTAANPSRFKANASSVIVVNCTVGPCTGAPFDAELIGSSFVGADAIDAVLGYGIWPMATASDIISGYVAFSTATAPSVATNPPAGSWSPRGHMHVGSAGAWKTGRFNPGNNPPLPETNFILDGAGNLVRSLHVSYIERFLENATSPATNQYSDAMVTYSGGVASDRYITPDNSLIIGRWTGGQMIIADNLGVLPTQVNNLGATSSYWFMTTAVPTNYVPQLVGTTSYTQIGATLPTDSFGNVGTLPVASLSADFTAQTVNASVAFTIASQSLTIANPAIPFWMGSEFFEGTLELGTAPTVSCSGTGCVAPGVGGYKGWLTGEFAGDTASSANLAYKAWPTAPTDSLVTDVIQGVVAFYSGTAPTVGANPPTGTWESFSHLPVGTSGAWKRGRFNPGSNPPQSEASFILDGAGNLVRSMHVNYNERAVWNGGTSTTNAYGDAMVSYSGGVASDRYITPDNSLIIGRWTGGQLTVTDNLGIQPDLVKNLGVTSAYWGITSPSPVNYVPSLTGTTTYTQGGATLPTDSFGNVGTTPVASLSANFTNQTIDASVAFTIANQNLTIANPAIPIAAGANYFDAMLELGTQPTVSCTGTGCSGGGYQGFMTGSFAGSQATSVDLSYKTWPTTTPDALVADIIQGVVAFYTATPPTPAPAQAYVANHIAVETAGGMNFNSGMLASQADLVYFAGGTSTSGALQSMTFRDIGGGSNWMQTSSIIGGTATSANATSYASTGIEYGAWTDYTEQSGSWSTSLGGTYGNAPSAWMYGPSGYVDAAYMSGPSIIGAMAGTFTYQLDGATAPTSSQSGLTGVMNSATVTADFVNMLVSASLDLTMPGDENWGASVTNTPIALGMGALNMSPVVTYSVGAGAPLAACATCSGNMSANFTGQNLAGIIASYELYNNANTGSSDVSGAVALTRNWAGNTNPAVADDVAAPTGNIEVATVGQGYNSVQSYPLASSTTTGNLLTAFGSSGAGFSNMTTVTCTTCTTTPTGQVATSGIYYGTWDAGTYDQFYSSTFTAGTMPPSYWITGPEAGPLYLPQALTGTASYAFDSGQVSNGMGVAGTVAGTTTLTLDFSKQAVGINLDFSLADTATPTPVVHNWNVSTTPGNEAALGNGHGIGSAAFRASTYGGGGEGLLTVSVDGGPTPVTVNNANVYGQLTGVGLNGAIMSFDLNGVLNPATTPTFENISGVAAFTGTPQNTATSHRYVAASFYDPFTAVPQPMMGLYANDPARVTQDVAGLAGNLTQFDTQIITGNGGASMIFASNTSTLIDQGSDPVTGISWGRWAGGTFNATDRITGGVTPVTQSGSLHWIAESAATSATTLPLVGTYTYVNAGGTAPTDNLGNSGTLNSATLTADFTARTVNMGVNVTVNGATLDAVGANVPIIQKTVFYASSQEPAASTSQLNVTCTGTCGATLGGTVIGKFSGAGATGAAMTYGLQNGNNVVSGVTAFHQ